MHDRRRGKKRVGKREFFSVTLEYSYPSPINGHMGRETSTAITANISSGGLGIYTDRHLAAGLGLKVFSAQLKDRPNEAEVRWCRRISNSLFRVGLMFTEPGRGSA